VIRRLGRGGMGVVDLAVDEHGNQVALKRLSLHGTPEELAKARQRIHREAEVLLQLDHPAIVRLREVYDDGDDLVLVMDHLAGGNLATRVNEGGPLPSAQIRDIADRLLDALATAHRQGILHRDIKPANVLFDADGRAYLVDFGAATHRDATPGLTATEMVVGTPGFMAPEQARGEPATAASDVFSLGATLAFAATGQGPFGTADPRVLMLRAASGRTEKLPRELNPDLRRRLDAMLAADPLRRPTAAEARGGTAGTSPRPVVRAGRGGRGAVPDRRVLVAVAVVAALLLAVGVALALGAFRPDDEAPAAPATTARPQPTTSTSEPCTDKPYQPCGEPVAPNTDGERCVDGAQDYDDDPANGCEAVPDDNPTDLELTADNPITGTIVPEDEVDRYLRPVVDKPNALGNGTLHIRFTAPKGAVYRITVYDEDGDEMDSATSTNGEEVDLSFTEPNIFTGDDTTFTVEIRNEPGFTPVAAPYRLTTSGQY